MSDSLAPDIHTWVTHHIGTIHNAQKLAGSTSTTLYRLTAQKGEYVLRLFDNAKWLAEEPDLAPHEAAALQKAATGTITSPQLVVFDDGVACTIPVLLMAWLPGDILLAPPDMDTWLYQIARTLAAIHTLDGDNFGWQYKLWYSPDHFAPQHWSKYPDLWERAAAIVSKPAPSTPIRFIHRDYHPTNLLWQNGRISGVVDWVNACRGPIAVDVAHCRNNLVCIYGVDIANQFMRHYASLSGYEQHPYWDLNGLFDFFNNVEPVVYDPWLEFGVTNLTDDLIRERADAYLVDIMRRWDALA